MGPHHPPRLSIHGEEEDEPLALRRRDRSGLELERKDRREVEPVGCEGSIGGRDQMVVGRGDEARPEWSGRSVAACACPQGRDRGLQIVRIGVDGRRQVRELEARSQLLGAVRQTVVQRRQD